MGVWGGACVLWGKHVLMSWCFSPVGELVVEATTVIDLICNNNKFNSNNVISFLFCVNHIMQGSRLRASGFVWSTSWVPDYCRSWCRFPKKSDRFKKLYTGGSKIHQPIKMFPFYLKNKPREPVQPGRGGGSHRKKQGNSTGCSRISYIVHNKQNNMDN